MYQGEYSDEAIAKAREIYKMASPFKRHVIENAYVAEQSNDSYSAYMNGFVHGLAFAHWYPALIEKAWTELAEYMGEIMKTGGTSLPKDLTLEQLEQSMKEGLWELVKDLT